MDWVKKNWILLACGLIAVAAIGIGVWTLMGFDQVRSQTQSIADVASQLDRVRNNAANEQMISEARQHFDTAFAGTKKALEEALAVNERQPLQEGVFPTAQAPDSGYQFRLAYRQAVNELPQVLRGGRAPSGEMVQQIINRLEDKHRKQLKFQVVGGELNVPQAPDVSGYVPRVSRAVPADMRGGMDRGNFDRGGMDRGGMDRGGMDRGNFDRGGMDRGGMDRGNFDRGGMGAPYSRQPGALTAGRTPEGAIPPREVLLPQAQQIAIYQVATAIWTYTGEQSFMVHPMVESVERPTPVDLWAAQMFYWIDQDVAQALRNVNEQAAAQLPEDQQWVAHLPVKHLVSLDISDYITSSADRDISGGGRGGGFSSGSMSVLHGGQAGRSGSGNMAIGTTDLSFTGRGRTGEYDVVQFALNLVIDARALPRVLTALAKQNFYTPITVQYRDVNMTAARERGYLYGSEPAIDVDIVCEALFFREIYEKMMPEEVKARLGGEGAAGGAGAFRR